jgi:hypothetical protein
MLTAARVHELLTYEPATGIFRWRVSRRGGVKAGDVAGCIDPLGYVMITVDDVRYRAHRLAFLYMTGEWPAASTDHRDGDRSNNRWANLREATHGQNSANRGTWSKSGHKGASRNGNRWQAKIQHEGQSYYLGTFDTVREASAAYAEAAYALHGEFARVA